MQNRPPDEDGCVAMATGCLLILLAWVIPTAIILGAVWITVNWIL